MSRPVLVAAWALSVLPFLLEALTGGALAIDGGTRFALALLPWLALIGLPRGPARRRSAPRAAWLVPVAAALPPLGLAAGLDLASGGRGAGFARGALLAAAQLLLWSRAAEEARGSAAARSLYAGLWLVLVPLAAAAAVALGWAVRTGDGTGAGGLDAFLSAAPLVWAHHRGLEVSGPDPAGWASALVAAGVLGVVHLLRAREREPRAG